MFFQWLCEFRSQARYLDSSQGVTEWCVVGLCLFLRLSAAVHFLALVGCKHGFRFALPSQVMSANRVARQKGTQETL